MLFFDQKFVKKIRKNYEFVVSEKKGFKALSAGKMLVLNDFIYFSFFNF